MQLFDAVSGQLRPRRQRRVDCKSSRGDVLTQHVMPGKCCSAGSEGEGFGDRLKRLFPDPVQHAPISLAFTALPEKQRDELLSLDDEDLAAVLKLLPQPASGEGAPQSGSHAAHRKIQFWHCRITEGSAVAVPSAETALCCYNKSSPSPLA
jgi:hypothetical protein